MMSIFIGFFFLFGFCLYPFRDFIHPHLLANKLQAIAPAGFNGLIMIFKNWSFTLFYVKKPLDFTTFDWLMIYYMFRQLLSIALLMPLVALAQIPAPSPAQSSPVYIVNATIHCGDGKVLNRATVGFEKGKITFLEDIE